MESVLSWIVVVCKGVNGKESNCKIWPFKKVVTGKNESLFCAEILFSSENIFLLSDEVQLVKNKIIIEKESSFIYQN